MKGFAGWQFLHVLYIFTSASVQTISSSCCTLLLNPGVSTIVTPGLPSRPENSKRRLPDKYRLMIKCRLETN